MDRRRIGKWYREWEVNGQEERRKNRQGAKEERSKNSLAG